MDTAITSGSTPKSGQQPAVLVDFDAYSYNPRVQNWIDSKLKSAQFVLFVTDPEHADFDATNPIWAQAPEWAAVIRNNGNLRSFEFKVAALSAVTTYSNLIPVIGIDDDYAVLQMYEESGMLMTYTSQEIHFF